ncbi:hypothetical protein [Xanthomonas campestris]|uniref:hypothetical protein n=1 Tax=Xanthomonas campestris TaxID=339 RepID=UPI00236882C6|nr:hypothetical protein [Xanthomonas campestris]
MSVAWKQSALDARTALLASALARAIDIPDPQMYSAACEQDDRIEPRPTRWMVPPSITLGHCRERV